MPALARRTSLDLVVEERSCWHLGFCLESAAAKIPALSKPAFGARHASILQALLRASGNVVGAPGIDGVMHHLECRLRPITRESNRPEFRSRIAGSDGDSGQSNPGQADA